MDAPNAGDLAKGVGEGDKLMRVNMKFAATVNGEAQGMEQVYVFKHDEADGVVPVTLKAEAHDGKDVHVIFTNHKLTGPEVTQHIFDHQLMDFINKTRRGSNGGDDPEFEEPVVLLLDGDHSNIFSMKTREDECNKKNIRLALTSASQTQNESDKDADKEFKDMKTHINSDRANLYAEQQHEKLKRLHQQIITQSGLSFGSTLIHTIATGILKAQFATCLSSTSASKSTALRVTGHWPYNAMQIFSRHPGMSTVPLEVKKSYINQCENVFKPIFAEKGHLTARICDEYKLPETENQKRAREKGHKVTVHR
jgi:hypothetical protein